MIGGYGKFSVGGYLEKTFSGLPAHTNLRLRATLFKIDRWNGRRFQVLVDGTAAWESSPYTWGGQYLCGNMGPQQGDRAVDVDVTTAHTAGSATIRFTSTVSSNTEYWGLQGVTVEAVDAA